MSEPVIVRPLTVQQARAMPGSFTAFERTDGEEIWEGVSWVTMFDERDFDEGDWPFEVREVVMVPVEIRRFKVGLHEFEPCDDAENECDRCGGEADSEFHTPAPASPPRD